MNIFVLSDGFIRLKNCLVFYIISMMADFKKFLNKNRIFYCKEITYAS